MLTQVGRADAAGGLDAALPALRRTLAAYAAVDFATVGTAPSLTPVKLHFRCAGKLSVDKYIYTMHMARLPDGKKLSSDMFKLSDVNGGNTWYSFSVSPAKSGNGYLLKKLDLNGPGANPAGCTFRFPVFDSTSGMPYATLFEGPSVTVTRAGNMTVGDEVRFEVAVSGVRRAGDRSTHRAVYQFDPAKNWVCTAVDRYYEAEPPALHTQMLATYGPEAAPGFYPMLRLVDQRVEATGKTTPNNETTFERYEPCGPFPEADCTLTAFGLPEPAGVDWSRPALRWVYLLAAAAGFGVAAAGFGFLRRRAGRAAAA